MEKLLPTLKIKPIFLINIFRLNTILSQTTVSYQKINHILQKLSSSNIEDEDIYRIIKTLDINKAHGYDEVKIRMLKLCGESIVKPLSIIFSNVNLRRLSLISGKKQMLF